LTFPSGELGELDLNLFVGVGLGGGLGLPVRRREDAERDRNTCFKVQVGGFGRRGSLLLNLPRTERRTRRMTLASFPGKKSSERGEGGLWTDPSSFSIEFQQGKENGVWDLWLSVSGREMQGAEGGRTRSGPGCSSEPPSNMHLRRVSLDLMLVGGESNCVMKTQWERANCLCARRSRGPLAVVRRKQAPRAAGAPERLFTCCGAMSCLLPPELA